MNEQYTHEGSSGPGEHGIVVPPSPAGDDRVDDAVTGLSRLPDLPVDEHVTVLEEVHGKLRDILGDLSDLGEGRP